MTMEETDFTLSSLVTFGVSEELVAILDTVAAGSLLDGRSRCTKNSIYNICRLLLTHSYRRPIFEMAHYMAAISSLSTDITKTLYLDEAVYPESFRAATASWQSNKHLSFTQTSSGVELQFKDEIFELHDSRINLMAGWMDVLIFIIPSFTNSCENFAEKCTLVDIQAFAKTVQVQLKTYLEKHLRTPAEISEGMFWVGWVKDNVESDSPNPIDDDDVVEFWRSNWNERDFDFTKFSSVATSANNFYLAAVKGEQQWLVKHAGSLDIKNEEGDAWVDNIAGVEDAFWLAMQGLADLDLSMERTADIPSQLSSVGDVNEDPLTVLSVGECGKIKFLTGNQLKELASFVPCAPEQLLNLPLRVHIFGKQQARITGSLQNKDKATFSALLKGEEVITPDFCVERLESLLAAIAAARQATAHILVMGGHARGTILMLLAAGIEPIAGADLTLLKAQAQSKTEVWQAACHKAFMANNRAGFKTLPESDELDAYALGDEKLSQLQQICEPLVEQYRRYADSVKAQSQYAQDTQTFTQQFNDIYGDRL